MNTKALTIVGDRLATMSDHRPAPDRDLSDRITKACDGNAYCPPKHQGRYGWIRNELKSLNGTEVTIETVRKWIQGEARPRHDKLASLAQILGVDEGWLAYGADNPTPRERAAHNAAVDGAVNLVAGLIQMDGGAAAFPEDDKTGVHLHAIIKGGKFDIHCTLGTREDGVLKFDAPSPFEHLVVLGVVRDGFTLKIYEIMHDLIASGKRRGPSIDVEVAEGDPGLRPIESFKQRL